MGGEATQGPAPNYARFFGYMNLFVASMLTLVLANNLLLLLLGWEGVGLCSYLLIGFWYRDEVNGLAGRKAFIVTRAGDTAFILGLFLLFDRLGTLNIQLLMQRAAAHWHAGAAVAEVAAFLLLGGAVGKSAQLPLQTWLPDAMAGPTPTSALIHAATMVTAGVYLIARTHVLYTLAPAAMLAVAIIGLATLLLAGCSALAQDDIKRILAYSTISQIGYMFLALGVGAWSAAIFHLVVHAFFKGLLFLAAGVVIQALDEEHNIFKMGGLRHKMPLAFWCFVFAGASLAGLPLITAGFYSKGLIIWQAWASTGYPVGGSAGLWAGALLGAFLTALYIFRLIFVVFYGAERNPRPAPLPGPRMQWPMAILAFLSMLAGFFDLPAAFGGRALLSHFLAPALPMLDLARPSGLTEPLSEIIAAIVFFAGLYLAWLFYLQKPSLTEALMAGAFPRGLRRYWFSDWGMDWLYDQALVRPTIAFARVNKGDVVDRAFEGVGAACRGFYHLLAPTESGYLRRYAGWIAAGAILLVILGMVK
ncbi:MAG: NADH-quinone oxidoreductase subunit L [Terriglobales bacterium]